MALVTIDNLRIGFRGPLLLDGVTCQIDAGQRIGLLGRNGAGKTTLMRILCGQVEPDDGTVVLEPAARVSRLPQNVPRGITGRVPEVIARGLSPAADEDHPWKSQQQVEQIMSRMKLDQEARIEHLSSGMKRRVLLAQVLVSHPDLLLLDEPTNHLDIDAIQWLEQFLLRRRGTLLFVTHDRTFLQNLATRILEIDRGRLFDWSCDYGTFLDRKEAALAAQEKQEALFDKKLAQEEAWIRQGIKARRTRNEGRVRALERMRRERAGRRNPVGTARIEIQEGMRSGNLVAHVNNIAFAYDDQTIVDRFSTTIMRGDKVGIIGPNGAGKTTLLRLLLGKLSPQQGQVRLGTNLQIAYFDQLREQLDEAATVQDNVGDGYQSVPAGGKSKHIIGYLQDFLFSAERARTAVRFLSGGERNRVLLAKLFAKPANVIVLDEPTNDLDTETLELLEQRLVAFSGTVILVSHDRTFLNNVVTSTIAFEEGRVNEYVGGYDDWLRQRSEPSPPDKARSGKAATRSTAATTRQVDRSGQVDTAVEKRRLKYKEQQELSALPAAIEELESHIAEIHQRMAEPDFYQQGGDNIAREHALLKEYESRLAAAYARWEELERLAQP